VNTRTSEREASDADQAYQALASAYGLRSCETAIALDRTSLDAPPPRQRPGGARGTRGAVLGLVRLAGPGGPVWVRWWWSADEAHADWR